MQEYARIIVRFTYHVSTKECIGVRVSQRWKVQGCYFQMLTFPDASSLGKLASMCKLVKCASKLQC